MDLKPSELSVVKNVLLNCMGLKERERLLIVTDEPLSGVGELFYRGAKGLGFDPVILRYFPRKVHGEEPPDFVALALKDAHVALLLTSKSLSHTKARKDASRIGVRIASLPGISYEIIMRTLGIDYTKLQAKIKRVAKKLTGAKHIRVLTDKGTDISFSVTGRKGFADTGVYIKKGAFGNLPAGEACVAPVEKSPQGKIVFDASIAGFGKLDEPVEVEIEKGIIVKSKPPKFYKFLMKFGEKALYIAEFGIGLNPKARVTGNVLEDEKAVNTCHFAFGSNISFGGRIRAGVHIDGVLFSPLIYIDGKKLRL